MPNIAYLNLYYEKVSALNTLYEDALTFTAREDDFQLELTSISSGYTYHFNISYDSGMTWQSIELPSGQTYSLTTINRGSYIMINGNNTQSFYTKRFKFVTNKTCDVSGNIMTLIDATNYKTMTTIPYTSCFRGLFQSCKIVDASKLKLPATTLKSSCYEAMFYDCTSLTAAPELPATTLADSCYNSMFGYCTSLTTTPSLPATTLASYCYENMFEGCTSITVAPELPATTLAENCYEAMFADCTSLTAVPELPATTLASRCYSSMFWECTSLTTAPSLPAQILAPYCYSTMFYHCISLTSAPVLPATTLANNCYKNMFNSCRKLNYINILTNEYNNSGDQFTGWVASVAPTGTFVKYNTAEFPINSDDGIPIGWTVVNVNNEFEDKYLTIEAVSDTLQLRFVTSDQYNENTRQIYCSYDNGNSWSTITSSPGGTRFRVIRQGEKILLKGNNETYSYVESPGWGPGYENRLYSEDNGQYKVYGNIMSIVYGDNFREQTLLQGEHNFRHFFAETGLTDASNLILPATTLTTSCYLGMFERCISLTAAPELPATTLAQYCYNSMFAYCTSLTTSPELPATTLAPYCYNSMFAYCTSLTTSPELPATTLSQYCYGAMFDECYSLTIAPELPATTLAEGCYSSMFYHCSSLTTAPELPATTLASYCYENMLAICIELVEAPELPATTLAEGCYSGMFRNCGSLTAAPILPATILAEGCYSSMFSNCDILTAAPELPATMLVRSCYSYMFSNCYGLTSITCLATDISANYCTNNWVVGVASSGTFTKAASMSDWTTGTSGIPDRWTVVDAS